MSFELKKKIKNQENILGIMLQNFLNPIIIPILDDVGYDFCVIDMEHSSASFQDVQNLAMASKKLNIAVLVRPPKISYENIAKTLDMGVAGLMIPHIDTKEEAENVVKWSKYPPLGERGFGIRTTLLKKDNFVDRKEYVEWANESVIIFIQVESQKSVKNIDEILNYNEIDGVIVGPADFSLDLGDIGNYQNERLIELNENVLESCKKKGKAFGIHFGEIKEIQDWRKKGMNVLMLGTATGILKEKCQEIINHLKDEADKNVEKGSLY